MVFYSLLSGCSLHSVQVPGSSDQGQGTEQRSGLGKGYSGVCHRPNGGHVAWGTWGTWGTCCMWVCTLSAIIARTGQVPDRTASLFSCKFAFHQNGRRTHLEAGWPGLHIRQFETNF